MKLVQEMMGSEEMQEKMRQGGVLGEPEVTLLDQDRG